MALTTAGDPGDPGLSRGVRADPSGRVLWLDAARGLAVIAMVAYHLSFDLRFFGYVDWGVASSPAWRTFAASIASTFLFLVGVSLVVAHGTHIRWRPFARRLMVVAAGAAAVTVGTALAMPLPITFGILHAIATFSILALPFLRAPALLTALVATGVFALPFVWRSKIFSAPWLVPFGLAPVPPATFDYEPIFPWFAVTLLGIAMATAWPQRSRGVEGGALSRGLGQLGRWSLVIYLVHQPLLFGGFMALQTLR